MEEQTVKDETLILAVKKGFTPDIKQVSLYRGLMPMYEQPTQSLLQKWLREEHNLCVSVWYDIGWKVEVILIPDSEDVYDSIKTYDLYEEALEVGLQEALKLIKDGNKEGVY